MITVPVYITTLLFLMFSTLPINKIAELMILNVESPLLAKLLSCFKLLVYIEVLIKNRNTRRAKPYHFSTILLLLLAKVLEPHDYHRNYRNAFEKFLLKELL